MEWIELTIRTASGGIELLCAELTQAGFDSYMIDDAQEFQDFLDSAKDYWDYVDESLRERMADLSQVRLYLSEPTEVERLRALLQTLPARYPAFDFGPLTLRLEQVPEEDWENTWKAGYRPLPIGKRLLVVPRWMTVDDTDGRIPVILDMGLTFGTGEHDSTRMCMESLEELIQGGERLADLGSGSGILSIAALRLGAASAVGADIDPAAAHISQENAAANGFGHDRFCAQTGDVVSDPVFLQTLGGDYDIVCANIVAGVILRLLPLVPGLLKPGGTFLCSGILLEREQDIREKIAAVGMQVQQVRRTAQWCCLTASR